MSRDTKQLGSMLDGTVEPSSQAKSAMLSSDHPLERGESNAQKSNLNTLGADIETTAISNREQKQANGLPAELTDLEFDFDN